MVVIDDSYLEKWDIDNGADIEQWVLQERSSQDNSEQREGPDVVAGVLFSTGGDGCRPTC